MNRTTLETLLGEVAGGQLTPAQALERLSRFPSENLGFATVDHHRELRQGHPEVVFAQGKTMEQLVEICRRLTEASGGFLATRVSDAMGERLSAEHPEATWDPLGRTVYRAWRGAGDRIGGTVLVVSAGTSDLPVAYEAATTAEAFGASVERLNDVGVAGLHRILAASDQLTKASVVVVVAGMEGALPSVVGGLVRVPVIAVPTSVGYGASFGGLAALLGMLNSCSAGVTVVNIDNGFGAGVAAARIATAVAR